MSTSAQVTAISAPVVAASSIVYKGAALIAAQVMAFLGLIFLLHNIAPAIGSISLFAEILSMALLGMFAAIVCYQIIVRLPMLINYIKR